MVCRKNDERILETYLFINEAEQVRQRAIKPEQVVFHFEAGGTEQVTHIIGRRKADRQVIGHGILTQTLGIYECLGEIQRKFITRRTDRK